MTDLDLDDIVREEATPSAERSFDRLSRAFQSLAASAERYIAIEQEHLAMSRERLELQRQESDPTTLATKTAPIRDMFIDLMSALNGGNGGASSTPAGVDFDQDILGIHNSPSTGNASEGESKCKPNVEWTEERAAVEHQNPEE